MLFFKSILSESSLAIREIRDKGEKKKAGITPAFFLLHFSCDYFIASHSFLLLKLKTDNLTASKDATLQSREENILKLGLIYSRECL